MLTVVVGAGRWAPGLPRLVGFAAGLPWVAAEVETLEFDCRPCPGRTVAQ